MGWQGLNLRMTESKSVGLPLADTPSREPNYICSRDEPVAARKKPSLEGSVKVFREAGPTAIVVFQEETLERDAGLAGIKGRGHRKCAPREELARCFLVCLRLSLFDALT